jgi:hypothetical protein
MTQGRAAAPCAAGGLGGLRLTTSRTAVATFLTDFARKAFIGKLINQDRTHKLRWMLAARLSSLTQSIEVFLSQFEGKRFVFHRTP